MFHTLVLVLINMFLPLDPALKQLSRQGEKADKYKKLRVIEAPATDKSPINSFCLKIIAYERRLFLATS
jgi:hypothetical protein